MEENVEGEVTKNLTGQGVGWIIHQNTEDTENTQESETAKCAVN